MMAVTPVDQISQILEDAGFNRLSTPFKLSGLSFDVAAALVGTDKSQDLILVADTAFEAEQTILQNVESVARALDYAASRRPLTTVITGPRPTAAVLEAMARVSRVLAVGTVPSEEYAQSLQNWLAVLLPLKLPEPSASIADPYGEITSKAQSIGSEVLALVALASRGAGAVQTRLHEIIAESSPTIDEDDAL